MTRCAIADFLPLSARRAACDHTYAGGETIAGKPVGPRDEQGYCPLGRALEAMGVAAIPFPIGEEVRSAIVRYWLGGDHETPHGAPPVPITSVGVLMAARDFIDAWDRGRIADLADALGVAEAGR